MAAAADIPSWIALFLGVYTLAAGIGELRSPGSWAAMLVDFERQEGLRYLTGFVLLALGALIYLASPFDRADWLSVLITVLGAGMVLEGVVVLAWGRAYLHLVSSVFGGINRLWAMLSAGIGLVLICVALMRF